MFMSETIDLKSISIYIKYNLTFIKIYKFIKSVIKKSVIKGYNKIIIINTNLFKKFKKIIKKIEN